jgi:hypothetical protein
MSRKKRSRKAPTRIVECFSSSRLCSLLCAWPIWPTSSFPGGKSNRHHSQLQLYHLMDRLHIHMLLRGQRHRHSHTTSRIHPIHLLPGTNSLPHHRARTGGRRATLALTMIEISSENGFLSWVVNPFHECLGEDVWMRRGTSNPSIPLRPLV